MDRIPTTEEGFQKLKNEIEHLETVELPRVAKLIAQARAEGDLSENAEYHGQRENHALLQAKINRLKEKLARSYIVNKNDQPKDKIVFGARVTLIDLDSETEECYELVGPGEEDYSGDVMKILCNSPLGSQLLNHRVGDQIVATTPGGTIRYEVKSIE
jgi:transcription elongation factor GreA